MGLAESERRTPETGTSSGGHGKDAIGSSLPSTSASKRSKAASKAANTAIAAWEASGGGTTLARRCCRGLLSRSVARLLASFS